MTKNTYTISELSEEFGITPRTLRYYEDQKLIFPTRRGQSRLYSKKDRARLAWILRGKRVGFSIADMGKFLNLYDIEDGKSIQRELGIQNCQERIRVLEQQKNDIDETISELKDIIEMFKHWNQNSNNRKARV
ncbi:MAG: MerR family DNA-binding transcriptional regulator [Emcibacter sp.]|nr:MerR family DNA-binding transcriptional regulator [Emcibacter sp.]